MTSTEGSGAPYKHAKLPFAALRDVMSSREAIDVPSERVFVVFSPTGHVLGSCEPISRNNQ